MHVHPQAIPGLLVIEPTPIPDERGFFVRIMDAPTWHAAGINIAAFVQENQSRSRPGTLRGIHVTAAPGETKVVRCARGRVWDVVVDLRPSSPTFTQWDAFTLDDVAHIQIVIPPGCGHGFLAQTEADICYRHSDLYVPGRDISIAWDDPALGIAWPLEESPILSDRDRKARSLQSSMSDLQQWFGAPRQ